MGLIGIIFAALIGAFIGCIVGTVVGAIAIPTLILDGRALNPLDAISSIINGPKDHI